MPKALRTWSFSFEDTHLTHYGGLVLFQRFCQKLQLRRRLQRQVRISQRNADYVPADLLLALIYAVAVGVRRINKTELLQYNGAFLDLLGLDRFPNQTTLRRLLQRLSPQNIRQLVVLHDRLRAQFLARPTAPSSLILDLDSVVLTLYGHQQGARVGYNPKKKGRRSYHPALCFEAYLGKVPSGAWLANVAFFHIVLFAYDLVHWCRRFCLPIPYKTATVETVRSDFFVLPARMVSRAGQNVLQLPKDYVHREAFLFAFRKASAVRISKKT